MNKKGLSPVIATVLLVSLAVIMALLIFLWARGTIAEKYLKFNEPVDRSCESALFDVEMFSSGQVNVVNRGNVPIYGFKLMVAGNGELNNLTEFHCMDGSFPVTIKNGQTCGQNIGASVVNVDNQVLVVPIILAERGQQSVPYECESSLGKTITVK